MVSPSSLDPRLIIDVALHTSPAGNSTLITRNNRLLYCFKQAGIEFVKARIIDINKFNNGHFTSVNGGLEVDVVPGVGELVNPHEPTLKSSYLSILDQQLDAGSTERLESRTTPRVSMHGDHVASRSCGEMQRDRTPSPSILTAQTSPTEQPPTEYPPIKHPASGSWRGPNLAIPLKLHVHPSAFKSPPGLEAPAPTPMYVTPAVVDGQETFRCSINRPNTTAVAATAPSANTREHAQTVWKFIPPQALATRVPHACCSDSVRPR